MAEPLEKKSTYKQGPRPPVVVILGHVDHGKTSLIDYIRKAKVTEKEEGGITQHVGAYQIEHGGSAITLLDTPGHEAFSAMRARGASVADIALLVVAADDGIMPQTKEALEHIRKTALPFIVVINKIDKSNVDGQKARTQLLEESVTLEGFGGNTPVVEVSAKTGQGIDDLLGTIVLLWEVEGHEARVEGPAEGVVIEAFLDARRGPSATLLVREGILHAGDIAAAASSFGRIRIMESFLGKPLPEAGSSTPVVVLGFETPPGVGEKFHVMASSEEAEQYVVRKERKHDMRQVVELAEGQKLVNIILKADVQGTLEAMGELIKNLQNERIATRLLAEGVGEIGDADVRLASSGKALIVGFRVGASASAERLAQQEKVFILSSPIVYRLVEELRGHLEELTKEVQSVETVIGKAKVLAIFRTEAGRMIVGGRVIEGEVRRGVRVKVYKGEQIAGEGKIVQLKIQDKEMGSIAQNQECGILFEGSVKIQEGDILEAYVIEKKTT